jgi:hypothetical protein
MKRREFLKTCAAMTGSTVVAGPLIGRAADDNRPAGKLAIDCDFPGGNIVVERVEGDDVYVHQDLRDTAGWWFYWCFRLRGAAGRTLRFHFTNKNVFAARGPCVSPDGGKTWTWLGNGATEGTAFTYTFPDRAREVRFCLAIPYQEADLDAFLEQHAGSPHLKAEPHATTKRGRTNRRLRLGKLDGEPKHRALFTCRHHSCEMMASWALEGLMETVLSDTADGRWYRENVEVLAIPMVDLDGVEDGDQGKNRKPHDHNRDYLGDSIYPTVAATRKFVPEWSGGRLRFGMDMHCPYIRGGGDGPSSNERLFLVGHPSEEMWKRQQAFGRILQEVQSGPLVYNPKHNIPWGQAWNNMKEARSSSRWMADLPGIQVGVTIEIPYADVAGTPVTADSARDLGRDLARAIRRYVETIEQTPSQPTT